MIPTVFCDSFACAVIYGPRVRDLGGRPPFGSGVASIATCCEQRLKTSTTNPLTDSESANGFMTNLSQLTLGESLDRKECQ